jgi:small nuclear ribonucleoprotein (snRNP)-like protein
MDPVKVVVRLIDGRVIKGYSQNFNPNRPSFHMNEEDGGKPLHNSILLEMKEIKAVFFVKTFEGDREYDERKDFIQGDRLQGRKVEVIFVDDEVIRGSTVGYDPQRPGFFLIPVDPRSNNIRIFVVSRALKDIRFLAEEQKTAQYRYG